MNQSDNKWLALAILLTAPLLSVIDIFIINVAVPSIKIGIHASDGEIQMVIAGYLLSYATFQIASGRAGDHFGRKKLFFWGMFFFTLTSCLCGLSNTPLQLNISRFLQGISAALMMPQTIALIQFIFPEQKERTKAIGLLGITLGAASITGQFLGGYLSDTHFAIAGWRLIFFINLPVGLLALWATAKYLKETPKNANVKFDYWGVVILTAALICLIYPIIQGREQNWPVWSIIMLTGSIFIFYYFIANQKQKLRQNKTPLINMDLFKIKDFNLGLISVLFYFMMHTSYLLFVTVYFQNGLGFSAYQSGLFFVIFGSCFTISSFSSIRLVALYGKKIIQVGIAVIFIAFILQLYFFKSGINHAVIYGLMALNGFGAGLVLPSLMNITLKSIPQHFIGAASGVYATIQQASSALGVSVIGGVFFFMTENHGKSFHQAYEFSMYAEILCILIVGIVIFRISDLKK